LGNTGGGTAAELASQFGINLRALEFWRNSLKVVEKRVKRYETLP
jgi:oligoendopeptidase F